MKKIITISREFGSGGGTIGKAVANNLGYDYVDKKIILEAARKSNLDINRTLELEEAIPLNFGFTQSLFDFYNKPLSEKIFEAQRDSVKEIAEKGNCIIIGRNANSILSEYDHCLHVFIHANMNWRLERLRKDMPDLSDEKIIRKIKSVDKARTKYCSYFTSTDFGAAANYDLTLNTASIGIDTAVHIICELAKSDF